MTQSSVGVPFHFLLRDIAQYDNTVDDSFNRIFAAFVLLVDVRVCCADLVCSTDAAHAPSGPKPSFSAPFLSYLSDVSRIGLGSNYTNQLRVVNYSTKYVYVWDDRNFPAYPPAHPYLEVSHVCRL